MECLQDGQGLEHLPCEDVLRYQALPGVRDMQEDPIVVPWHQWEGHLEDGARLFKAWWSLEVETREVQIS